MPDTRSMSPVRPRWWIEAVGVADVLVTGGEPAVRPELLGRTLRRLPERGAGVAITSQIDGIRTSRRPGVSVAPITAPASSTRRSSTLGIAWPDEPGLRRAGVLPMIM